MTVKTNAKTSWETLNARLKSGMNSQIAGVSVRLGDLSTQVASITEMLGDGLDYLPLTGGKLSGNIEFSNGSWIGLNSDPNWQNELKIESHPPTSEQGSIGHSALVLYTDNQVGLQRNGFLLRAADVDNNIGHNLIGRSNGELLWNDSHVMTESDMASVFSDIASTMSGMWDVKIYLTESSTSFHTTSLDSLRSRLFVKKGIFPRNCGWLNYGATDTKTETSTASQTVLQEPWGIYADYIYWGRQYVYCSKPVTVSTTFYTDDYGDLFINEQHLSAQPEVASVPVTLSFNEGWNILDLVYQEGIGGANGYLGLDLARGDIDGIVYAGAMRLPSFAFGAQATLVPNTPSDDSSSNNVSVDDIASVLRSMTTYHSGDTCSFNKLITGGFVTTGSTEIAFSVTVPKSLSGITSISCTTLMANIRDRTPGTYLMQSYTASGYNYKGTGWTVNCTKASDNAVTVRVTRNKAIVDNEDTTVDNNTPLGIEIMSMVLTFA